MTVAELVEFHARRFEVLAGAGADWLACETIPALGEAVALAQLLSRPGAPPAWISFTSPDGLRTSHGEPLGECARLLDPMPQVHALGVNCVKPEVVGDAIRSLRTGTGKPIVVYPNSGERWSGETRDWQGAPDGGSLASLAPGWVAAGATMIGGCCRTGPADIAGLCAAIAPAAR